MYLLISQMFCSKTSDFVIKVKKKIKENEKVKIIIPYILSKSA